VPWNVTRQATLLPIVWTRPLNLRHVDDSTLWKQNKDFYKKCFYWVCNFAFVCRLKNYVLEACIFFEILLSLMNALKAALFFRRFFLGGELGGKTVAKWLSGGLLFLLWLIFIVIASLRAHGHIWPTRLWTFTNILLQRLEKIYTTGWTSCYKNCTTWPLSEQWQRTGLMTKQKCLFRLL